MIVTKFLKGSVKSLINILPVYSKLWHQITVWSELYSKLLNFYEFKVLQSIPPLPFDK